MKIIIADRIELKDMLCRSFRSKFTGAMITQERKTPSILQDPDTSQFIKYYLHNKSKKHCFEDMRYEEAPNFTSLDKLRIDLPKKVDI